MLKERWLEIFETEIDGTPRPCDHELRWYHRLASWAHQRIEGMPLAERQNWHDKLPDWVCEAYERVSFDFPCWKCEADRYREYGATTKTDDDVRARFPLPWPDEDDDDPLAFDEDDDAEG